MDGRQMVSVDLFTVGKELLIGKTVNTNAHWVGGRLAKMGTMIRRTVVVTDSLSEISSALREILSRNPDFVIVVGGLGPTPDDMTLKGVARGLGLGLRTDREAVEMMRERYRRIRNEELVLTPARRKMATLPVGSAPLYNDAGTAPGVRIVKGRTIIFCLPGVPREMKSIFRKTAEKEIRQKLGTLYTRTAVMDLEKVPESILAPLLRDAIKRNPAAYIKSHPKGVRDGVSHVELDFAITSPRKGDAEAESRDLVAFFEKGVAELGGAITKRRTVDTS